MDNTLKRQPKEDHKPQAEQKPQEKQDPWILYTLEDARKERPPREYIVDGIFRLPSLNIVYAAPGDLKTMLMIDLCGCVAAGVDWLPPAPWQDGAAPIKTKKGAALWLDFDNGQDEMMDRIEAISNTLELANDAPFYYYVMPDPWLNAADPLQIGQLIQRAQSLETKLIVIDNLGTISGGIDENSSQMIKPMSNLRRLAEETGAAVVLIHHQRKGNGFKAGRAGDSLRGHSSIEAAINLALHVEREPNSDTLNIKSTKTRGTDVYPFGAVFTYEHKPGTKDLAKFRFFGLQGKDDSSAGAIEREILAVLKDGMLNQSHLIDAVKNNGLEVGKDRILDMLNRLEVNNKIASTRGAHNAKVYTLR